MNVGGDRSGSESSEPFATAGRPGDDRSLLVLVTGGYFGAILGSVASAWGAPQLLGYGLDRVRRPTGALAVDGGLISIAFDVTAAFFPVVFAACVVVIDIVLVRRFAERATPNRRGVAIWGLLATGALALLLFPVTRIVPPYGFVQLLSAPVWGGVVGIGTLVTAAAVAGVVGVSIPIDVSARGRSLTDAGMRAVTAARIDPVVTLYSVGLLLVGWGFGGALFVVGVGVFGLALGIFLLGFLLLPLVVVVWGLAAFAFAAGHVYYRRRTVSNHDER